MEVAVRDDDPIPQFDDAFGSSRDIRIVSDDDDRPTFLAKFGEYFEHFLATAAIQRAGGFVGEDNLGSVDQSPRNRDALLLTP
jgi:hypothetical protein